MKNLLLITLIATSLNAFAGNTSKYFSKKFTGSSEAEVIQMANDAIPSIVNLTDRRLRQDMSWENCRLRSRNIEIDKLSVGSYRKYENGQFVLKYVATLGFWNNDCWEPNS